MSEDRYDFGRNWSELAADFDIEHLDHATRGMASISGDLRGARVIDLGSGSGLHAAAAFILGAASVDAIDYDPVCVATTRAVLEKFAPNRAWTVAKGDALDPSTLPPKTFDVVYSWGVLHHTGNLWKGIDNAAALVAEGGRFCVALYLKTPMCGAWRLEKAIYARQKWLRPFIKWPFVAVRLAARQLRQRDALSFVRNYRRQRGMEFLTDVDDWLGGYPYESVTPGALKSRMKELGFTLEAAANEIAGKGFLGTGCGEWRFRRTGRQQEIS